MATKPRFHKIHSVEQLHALESPVRQEIVGALEFLGTCTVADLGARLRRTPASLYYHLRALEEAQLVEVAGTSPSATRTRAVYRLRHRWIRTDAETQAPGFLEGLGRFHVSLIRLAGKRVLAALRTRRTVRRGPRRDMRVEQLNIRLDAAGVRELNRRLDAVTAFAFEHREACAGKLHSVTVVHTRVPDNER